MLKKQIKNTMRTGITSLAGMGVMGTLGGMPGVPAGASAVPVAALNLTNVGQLTKNATLLVRRKKQK